MAWVAHGALRRSYMFFRMKFTSETSSSIAPRFKLRQKAVINPPNMWIRRANAHEAIIAPEIFQKAQKIIARRREGRSDQELLDQLTALWKRKGHLSSR